MTDTAVKVGRTKAQSAGIRQERQNPTVRLEMQRHQVLSGSCSNTCKNKRADEWACITA